MSIFKQSQSASTVPNFISSGATALGLGEMAGVAGNVAGGISKGIENLTGSDQADQNTVQDTEKSFNDLANQFKIIFSRYNVPIDTDTVKFVDPKQLQNYFGSNMPFNPYDGMEKITQALTQLLSASSSSPEFANSPNIIKQILDFSFNLYLRSKFDSSAVVSKLNEFSSALTSGDAYSRDIIFKELQGDYVGAMVDKMLLSLDKVGDPESMKDLSQLSDLAFQMLGKQSSDILAIQELKIDKNKTAFEKLKASEDLFRLMVPYTEASNELLRGFYSTLDNFYGSSAAKKIMDSPLGSWMVLSAAFKKLFSGLVSGSQEAFKNK